MPALDGVRGVAILLVLAYHFLGAPIGAFLGVDVFFVLSGFLITTLLLQEHEAGGGISLPGFYRRRALRLLPALFAMLGAYLLIEAANVALGSADQGALFAAVRGALAGGFYLSNFLQTWGGGVPAPLEHLWSLAAEEQFYLAWPLLLYGALRLGLRTRALVAATAALVVLAFGHQLVLSLRGASLHRLSFAPDVRSASLTVGCLAGVAFARGTIPGLLRSTTFQSLGVPILWTLSLLILLLLPSSSQLRFYGGTLVFDLTWVLLIVAAVLDQAGPWATMLALRPLVWVGRISYALYLWNWLILAALPFGRWPSLPLSFLAAFLSYRYVEQPFLRRKRRSVAPPVPAPVPA
jgi:peptidoglycan/LPS O-acetylase OafA/YrhL